MESIDLINNSDKLQLIEYIKEPERFGIWDKKENILLEEKGEGDKDPTRERLRTDEFIQKYYSDISSTSIDNKRSPILTDFAKRSPFLSILGTIDNKDKNSNNNNDKEEEEEPPVTREEKWRREQEEIKKWDNGLV